MVNADRELVKLVKEDREFESKHKQPRKLLE